MSTVLLRNERSHTIMLCFLLFGSWDFGKVNIRTQTTSLQDSRRASKSRHWLRGMAVDRARSCMDWNFRVSIASILSDNHRSGITLRLQTDLVVFHFEDYQKTSCRIDTPNRHPIHVNRLFCSSNVRDVLGSGW